MRVVIKDDNHQASLWAAHRIAEAINYKKTLTDRPFVLGLPTGSTPLGTYAEPIRMHKASRM